ncbi:MAG: hypothetical protein LUO93_09515, partial [Methanomicrobiales archaeon]|nr:hypothetical protein [Methanomicrobiales archaeon]
MAKLLTVNQIFTKFNPNKLIFKDWLNNYKLEFKKSSPSPVDWGDEKTNKRFELWLNEKYKASQKQKIFDIGKSVAEIGQKTLEKVATSPSDITDENGGEQE